MEEEDEFTEFIKIGGSNDGGDDEFGEMIKLDGSEPSKKKDLPFSPLSPKKQEQPTVGYEPLNLQSSSDSPTLKSTPSTSDGFKSSYSVTPSQKAGGVATTPVLRLDEKRSFEASQAIDKAKSTKVALETQIRDAKNIYDSQLEYLTNFKNEIERDDITDDVKNTLIEQYNTQLDDFKTVEDKLGRLVGSYESVNKAESDLGLVKSFHDAAQLEADNSAGSIFLKSVWNSSASAMLQGLGAITRLSNVVNPSLVPRNQEEWYSKIKEFSPDISDKEALDYSQNITEKFGEGLAPISVISDFLFNFGKDVQFELPESATKSVLDEGLTIENFANLTGAGIGSLLTMLAPTGLVGNAGRVAQIGAAWTSSSALTMGFLYDEAIENGVSKDEAAKFALAVSIPVGGIDAITGANFFGTKVAAKSLFKEILKKTGKGKITSEVLIDAAKESIPKRIVTGAIGRGKDIVGEGITEGIQGGIEEAGKFAYNVAEGKEVFKDITLEGTLKKMADEAIGGAFGATPISILQSSGNKKAIYEQVKELSKTKAGIEFFKKSLDLSLKNKVITQAQYDNIKGTVNGILDAEEMIPSTITDENKRADAAILLAEKNSLIQEIEGKDENLITNQKERIKEIDSELQLIAKGGERVSMGRREFGKEAKKEEKAEPKELTKEEELELSELEQDAEIAPLEGDEKARYEQLKAKKDAIQKSSTAEVDVRQQAQDGKEMGEGDKGLQESAQDGKPIQVEKEVISNNVKAEVDRVVNLDEASEDGATFNIDGTKYEGGGMIVPVASKNLYEGELTPQAISEFVEENKDKIGNNTVKVGIYKFPNSKKYSIDLNIVADSKNKSVALEIGRILGQESLYNLDTYQNEKTGATGQNPMQLTSEQFREVQSALSKGEIPNFLKAESKKQDLSPKIEKLKSALKNIAPKLKVVIHDTKDSFKGAIKNKGGEVGKKQNTFGGGFFDPNTDEIHLNLEEIKSNTLFHEGIHPILNAIEAVNPEIIDKLFNQVLEVEEKQGLKNEFGEPKYSVGFAKRYEGAVDEDGNAIKSPVQKMEAITEFIADVADGTVEINQSNFDKIKQFFVDLLASIGIDVSGDINTIGDLKKLAEKIRDSFESGREFELSESGLPVTEYPIEITDKNIQSQKPDPISKTAKVKKMTEDGEGNYVFYHYSGQDLTKKGIDPNKFGKNPITSREERPMTPVSFYYTEPDVAEPGVGNYAHVVKIPKDKVYPFNEDPLNLLEKAEKAFKKAHPDLAFDLNKQVAWVSKIASEKGFDMTVADWGGTKGREKRLRAQSPLSLKPELWQKPKAGTSNQIEVNEDLEYKSNRRKKIQSQAPYSAELVNGFYSPIEKAVGEISQEKATAAQFLAQIKKAKGVKGDELQYTGVEQWLKEQGDAKITKQDILDYMKENRIEIVEVVKGKKSVKESKIGSLKAEIEILIDEINDSISKNGSAPKELSDKLFQKHNELKQAEETFREQQYKDEKTLTKFSKYQLEGEKENYKEVLVTLPKDALTDTERDRYGELAKKEVFDGVDSFSDAERKEYSRLDKKSKQSREAGFSSSHFDEPNILVHLRMNTRTDADGNKVLFLEELQGDFPQEYRKQQMLVDDYIDKNKDKVIEAFKKKGILEVICP